MIHQIPSILIIHEFLDLWEFSLIYFLGIVNLNWPALSTVNLSFFAFLPAFLASTPSALANASATFFGSLSDMLCPAVGAFGACGISALLSLVFGFLIAFVETLGFAALKSAVLTKSCSAISVLISFSIISLYHAKPLMPLRLWISIVESNIDFDSEK